jgi:hypothetical protein
MEKMLILYVLLLGISLSVTSNPLIKSSLLPTTTQQHGVSSSGRHAPPTKNRVSRDLDRFLTSQTEPSSSVSSDLRFSSSSSTVQDGKAGKASKSGKNNIEPPCCMLCVKHVYNDLMLLEISETKRNEVLSRIVKHHREMKIATYPSLPATDKKITMSFIEQSLQAHATKAGSNGQAGLCCPICMYDYVLTDPDYDDEPIMKSAANGFLETQENTLSPYINQIWKKGRNYDEIVESKSSSLIETSSQVSKSGSAAKQNSAPPGMGAHTCCNVCPDDFKRKGGGVVLGFLELRERSRFSASKSGYGQGKGESRVEGGCCTVCASKFYGPSGYGAPPFSEPGNAMQNAGAGGFMRPPKAPAPPKSKKGGGK